MVDVMLAGIALTAARPLFVLVIGGVAVVTFGFFGGPLCGEQLGRASGEPREGASRGALPLLLLLGSSVAGSAGGLFWDRWGWLGVVVFVATLAAIALVVAIVPARSDALVPAPAVR